MVYASGLNGYLDQLERIAGLRATLRLVGRDSAVTAASDMATDLVAITDYFEDEQVDRHAEALRRASIMYLTACYAGLDLRIMQPYMVELLTNLEGAVIRLGSVRPRLAA